MSKQIVQVAGLEPSTVSDVARYAIQIRGVDSNGNYGPWSQVFLFDSGSDLPFDLEDGVEEIQANDLLIYSGTDWRGSPADSYARTTQKSFFSLGASTVDPVEDSDIVNKSYVDNQSVTVLESDVTQLNFGTRDELMTRTCTGNVVLTGTGYTPNVSKTIRFIAGASDRAFSFPASWVFLGAIPSQIDAGKIGVLALTCFGSAESDVVAAWSQQE